MESALPQNASSMNEVAARMNTNLPKFTTPKWRAATPKNVKLTTADKTLDQRMKLRFLEKRRARLKEELDFFASIFSDTDRGTACPVLYDSNGVAS